MSCLQNPHKNITSIINGICCEKLAATHQKENFTPKKEDEFIIAMADEVFFVRDTKIGKKYWSPVAKRIFLPL